MNLHGRPALIIGFVLAISACGGGLVGIKIKVVDENNVPIEDAAVALEFMLSEGSNSYRGHTDKKGKDSAIRFGTFGTWYLVTKEGYYDTKGDFGYGNHDATVILREKKNPIPMYARKTHLRADRKDLKGHWVGYDFMAGDYVPPHGNGLHKDFEFFYTFDEVDFFNNQYNLAIRFPNEGDGLIGFKVKDSTSKLKSDYLAPEVGCKSESKYYEYRSSDDPMESNFDRFRMYYFRIRSQVDEDGKVVSALYGKMSSEFPKLYYYLNPNDNDRNVEFDPKKNLFMNLPKEERQIGLTVHSTLNAHFSYLQEKWLQSKQLVSL
ncbi:MAG: hypothetical protein ACI868_000615 [Granulosicoccus sp.]|jgi:hypothetical protein